MGHIIKPFSLHLPHLSTTPPVPPAPPTTTVQPPPHSKHRPNPPPPHPSQPQPSQPRTLPRARAQRSISASVPLSTSSVHASAPPRYRPITNSLGGGETPAPCSSSAASSSRSSRRYSPCSATSRSSTVRPAASAHVSTAARARSQSSNVRRTPRSVVVYSTTPPLAPGASLGYPSNGSSDATWAQRRSRPRSWPRGPAAGKGFLSLRVAL
ncbi:hypothetical protein ZWY2020_010537 [Hordeum vulgare]|nr:hypothetical protein ZWY2020_010537 [Hordeum vulgare]